MLEVKKGKIMAEENSDSGPKRYRDAGLAERRQIQADVVQRYRYRVFRVVRRQVPWPAHWEEAEQEGTIGLLIALKKFDPDRGVPFGAFADPWIRNEIQRWIDVGVYWRKSPNRGKSEARQRAAENTFRQRLFNSMDAPIGQDGDGIPVTLYDCIPAIFDTESYASDAELREKLFAFAKTLTEEDREILFSENSQRVRSRHYLSLVERARAFVRGQDGDDISRSGKTG